MKYFFKLHDGTRYEIDELDYNNLTHRIATGRVMGFYAMRGKINAGMRFQFKYFMSLETEGKPKPKDEIVRNIDVNKRALKVVEPKEPPKDPNKCDHNWHNPEHYEYVVMNVSGKSQYRKRCLRCKAVSSLVKPKEVENAMKEIGKTLDDVILIEKTGKKK